MNEESYVERLFNTLNAVIDARIERALSQVDNNIQTTLEVEAPKKRRGRPKKEQPVIGVGNNPSEDAPAVEDAPTIEVPVVTLKQIQDVAGQLIKLNRLPEAKEALATFGIGRLSDLKEENYAEALGLLKALI